MKRKVIGIVVVILAVIITAKIGGILFRNTIGTTTAYASRYLAVFMIVVGVLAGLCAKIGLI